MSVRIYRFHDLKGAGVPFHRVYVARLEKRGQFPRRFSFGANSVGWVAAEIDAWVEGRIRARTPNGAEAELPTPTPDATDAGFDIPEHASATWRLLQTGTGWRGPHSKAVTEQNRRREWACRDVHR